MKTLQDLYKQIPTHTCKPGCNACCGPVPLSPQEAATLNIATQLTPTKYNSLDCIYSTEKGCSVYDKRPLLCRLYGVVKHMKCPHGGTPQRVLSQKEEDKIMAEYTKHHMPQ